VLAADTAGEAEIWDYKGTDMPPLSSDALRDYEWQMSVYAELYRAKTGRHPARAVLYFLNELKGKDGDPPVTVRPVRAVHVVDFRRLGVEPDGTPTLVKQGLGAFDLTAADIMACKTTRRWDPPAPGDMPDEKTCDICDIRWNCSGHPKGKYKPRLPV
jgi:putative RecB family exonuclease